ncbi:SMI1/KNR4 family protein [Gimesia sp.]|uniref:SMI1/KNR4 family protein n=1 Tax=Gimesia sp. TaxID=2024833 RepID=UPI003A9118C9
MTESEIQELEAASGCQLPSAYRGLLLHYPQRLTELAVALGDDELSMLFHAKESLFRANVDDAEYVSTIFPPYCFVIGETGNGDYYAIDTRSTVGRVFMGGPHQGEYPEDEKGNALPLEDSLYAYLGHVISVYEVCAADLEQDHEYRPPGKLRMCFHITLSLLLAPVALLFYLLLILLATLFMILVRLWERMRSFW